MTAKISPHRTCNGTWRLCLIAGLAFIPAIWGIAARASDDPAFACSNAAHSVAKETGVPENILRALASNGTDRKDADAEVLALWPWTVNVEGRSLWFETEKQAMKYVFNHFKNGARSFDIGCFQVNYRWHGHAFHSIEDMFNPMMNARYAASFISELHGKYGDWAEAVGAYRSRTKGFAQRYFRRNAGIHDGLPDGLLATEAPSPRKSATLQNPQTIGWSGSLVPLGEQPGTGLLRDSRGG